MNVTVTPPAVPAPPATSPLVSTPSSLFAGIELAARVDSAEARMIAEGATAAVTRDPSGGAFARPVAGGFACWGGSGSPLNKIAGLGFAGPIDDTELAAIEREYAARHTPVRVELSSLADPRIGELLCRRGYRLVGFENVLGLALRDDATWHLATGVEITESVPAELSLWLDVVVTGFAHPDAQGVAGQEEFAREAIEQVFRDLGAASGLHRYLARRHGEPAGAASLRIEDGLAQLCGAATLPAHRRRGVQSSLLAHRLAHAKSAGCDLTVVTTQPGSKSQQNVQRVGFQLLYVRAVLTLD